MKKIFGILLLCLSIASCSLKETPYSDVTKDTFYRTPQQCEAALRGLYASANYIYDYKFLYAVEACSDLWETWANDDNARLLISPANPGIGSTVWKYAYIAIMRANECIECISKAPISDELKLPYVAEARTMRAFYYYVLTSFFGDVPYYEMAVSDIETMEYIRSIGRIPANDIRQALCKDLKENALPYFTEGNGLRVRANQVENNHAGFALAAMLLAKMAMWNEDWDTAIDALEQLESVYGDIDSYPLDKIQWRYKNTDEGIFEIQHAWSESGAKFTGEVADYFRPAFKDGKYDGVKLDGMTESAGTHSQLLASKHYALYRSNKMSSDENTANAKAIFSTLPLKFSDEIYNSTRLYTDIDVDAIKSGVSERGRSIDYRAIYKLGFGDLENGNTFLWTRTDNRGYGGPQFWCPGMTKKFDSNNYRIFRYADAVLMKAECLYHKDRPEEAVTYINKLRKRAYTNPETGAVASDYQVKYTDDDALFQMIMDERARELGGEFQRKFDLVRWGIWESTLKKSGYLDANSYVLKNIKSYHVYYPIPDTECALSQGTLRNDAYMGTNEEKAE